ncbi:MAG: small basic protein [Candidatus Brocadiia bacterium]|jgi:small basic protein (TIGR04137 family)|nr:small basic protein [Candidatus Brocadiia bacterium]
MSLHKSLKIKNQHTRARNVLKREERLEKLQEDERWSEGVSVYGLPKVRVEVKAPRKHAKEKEAPDAEGVEAAEGAQGAPAEGEET